MNLSPSWKMAAKFQMILFWHQGIWVKSNEDLSYMKFILKISSAKWQPFCLNVLIKIWLVWCLGGALWAVINLVGDPCHNSLSHIAIIIKVQKGSNNCPPQWLKYWIPWWGNPMRIFVDFIVRNVKIYFDSLVQDCSNSSVYTLELLQSYTTSSIFIIKGAFHHNDTISRI